MVGKKDFEAIAQTEEFRKLHQSCRMHTMTSPASMASVFWAVERIVKNKVHGDIVECGVWKGGSMMMAALSLLNFNDTRRKLYLYDTFEGIPEPQDVDRDMLGHSAKKEYKERFINGKSTWCNSPLLEVEQNMQSTKYPKKNIVYVKGMVEDTIPNHAPEQIALLRLDTDWYASTKHELKHLYPRLVDGGILIIDDYGHWMGARKAVNEYFEGVWYDMIEVDYTARIIVK